MTISSSETLDVIEDFLVQSLILPLFLPGCSGFGHDGEPSAESGSGNLQTSRQTWATDEAPLATFDPQQTADPLVPLVPYTSPHSTGQGERHSPSVRVSGSVGDITYFIFHIVRAVLSLKAHWPLMPLCCISHLTMGSSTLSSLQKSKCFPHFLFWLSYHVSSLLLSLFGPLSSLRVPCCCVNKVKVKGWDSSAPSSNMQGHRFSVSALRQQQKTTTHAVDITAQHAQLWVRWREGEKAKPAL